MFKKLAQKLVREREKQTSLATNRLSVDFEERKSLFLNKMTHSALDMYERECDIKHFSQLVTSNPENQSHNRIMDELFASGVKDPFSDEELLELSANKRFLHDLGFDY